MDRDLPRIGLDSPGVTSTPTRSSGEAAIERKMAALERRALGSGADNGAPEDGEQTADPSAERSVTDHLGNDERGDRAALSDKLDTLARWLSRREDAPATAETPGSGTDTTRLTALERKLALFDAAAAARDNATEAEAREVPGTMTQEEFWRRHSGEYLPPSHTTPKPDVLEPFHDPREWVDRINPDPATPGRNNNCGECARATELSWHSVPAVSAAYGYPDSGGESDNRMEEWTGSQLRPMTFSEIGSKLTEEGSGGSALVAVGWRHGGGHWFNAVNYHGEVLAVDGQSGKVERWPPTEEGSGIDESLISESLAIVYDRSGRIIEGE